jgi:hypothetical protein
VVQVHLGPPVSEDGRQRTEDRNCKNGFLSVLCLLISVFWTGGVAQLGERLPCTQEAIGSIPFTSTTSEVREQKDWGYALSFVFKENLKIKLRA